MTFRHRAGVRPYTSPRGFAGPCVFGKQSLGPLRCGSLSRAPLLPRLRGGFAEFLGRGCPARLGILCRPTCVGLRYGRAAACLAAFPGALRGRVRFVASPPCPGTMGACFTTPARGSGDRGFQNPARPVARVTASSWRGRAVQECLPAVLIGYACRPRLRPRLTLGGRAFPRRPRASGAGDSLPGLATRASILTPARSTARRPRRFAAAREAPLPTGPKGPVPPLRRRA